MVSYYLSSYSHYFPYFLRNLTHCIVFLFLLKQFLMCDVFEHNKYYGTILEGAWIHYEALGPFLNQYIIEAFGWRAWFDCGMTEPMQSIVYGRAT